MIRLSPRQREVLELLARGLTTTDIAVELDIAKGTVIAHLNGLECKLRADKRGLVERARELGLIPPARAGDQ